MKLVSGLALVVLALGCDVASTLTPVEKQTGTPPPAGASQSGSLTLELTAPAQIQAGQPLPLKLAITNNGKEPAELELGGRPPHVFIVMTSAGTEVRRWSEREAVQMVLELRTLKPGERLEYDVEWIATDKDSKPLPPGSYLVRGVLNVNPPDKLETTPKEVVITAR
jgi:hypothetical protein